MAKEDLDAIRIYQDGYSNVGHVGAYCSAIESICDLTPSAPKTIAS